MKESLKILYKNNQSKFKNIIQQFPDEDLAGPFLMSPNQEYQNQKIKILIIGQETNGWGYFSEDINGGMKCYEEFNLGEHYYSSPFWNVARKIELAINNKKYSCAWTNISKFDVNSGKASGRYLEEISKVDDILLDEISITEPDIILFFTGPSIDNRIRNLYPHVEFNEVNGFKINQFAQLDHEKLPKNTFRTYHPKYLRISHLETPVIEYLRRIKT